MTNNQMVQQQNEMGHSFNNAGQSASRDRTLYTCRLEVGIENEKEFRVGSKVIQIARKIWQELTSFQENDGKTLLRGKGVGGAHESDEPLALCISCRDATCFEKAVAFAEAQLNKINQEFKEMCLEKGYPVPDLKEVRAVSDHPNHGHTSSISRDIRPDNEDHYNAPFDPYNTTFEMLRNDPNANRGRRPEGAPSEEDIDSLIEERNEARKAANYKRADEIREFLKIKGVVLMDDKGARGNKKGSQVTKWRYFDGAQNYRSSLAPSTGT